MGQHTAETCCTKITSADCWHRYECSNKGKYRHEGKPYCGIHYPPNVEKRRQKSMDRIAEEMRADTEKWERQAFNGKAGDACRALGIDDPSVIPELVALARGYRTETSAQCYDTGHIDAVLAKVKP